jgi:type VI secretion system secreted protein Hcp
MAFDTFMKIEGPDVAGESKAADHTGEIEIYSFSFGVSNPVTVGSGTTGLSGGKATMSSFNAMKKTDKASPVLFNGCCTGQAYDKITVSIRKAGGAAGQQEYLQYIFSNCMIESVQWSGSTGGDDSPIESLSFAFSKYEMQYKAQKPDNTLESSPIRGNYDVTQVK